MSSDKMTRVEEIRERHVDDSLTFKKARHEPSDTHDDRGALLEIVDQLTNENERLQYERDNWDGGAELDSLRKIVDAAREYILSLTTFRADEYGSRALLERQGIARRVLQDALAANDTEGKEPADARPASPLTRTNEGKK